ncbi:hypothetical protein Gohar_003066 [Gossypium harknessii]|uniref:Zinc knuckle CX2CX4HX4C domain-containing protein n=1 Tax=Gossypium harknessii TaxID=34285 RepID=A0A7J9HMV3_9ROSI|nr:hypothetical protein [Gossypium harknessii]
MEESGGDDREGRDEISLLAKELIQLSVKGSMVAPFKYENLPMFCFGCGRMGYGLKDCTQIVPAKKSKISDDPPYTMALKAQSKLIGKVSMKFNVLLKKVGVQCSYTGGKVVLPKSYGIIERGNNEIRGSQGNMELMGGGDAKGVGMYIWDKGG